MATGVTEIAREAKASKALVSRYINADPTLRISADMRERIESAKARVEAAGRTPRRRGRRRFAYNFVLPTQERFVPGPGFDYMAAAPALRSMQEVLNGRGFRFSVNFFDSDKRYEVIQDLVQSRDYCDGVISGGGLFDAAIGQLLRENQMPHISLERADERFRVNTVCAHAIVGLRETVGYLQELGHRRIGYLGVKRYRYPLLLAVLAEADMALEDENCIVIPRRKYEEGQQIYRSLTAEVFGRWLDGRPTATAVVCGNDYMALGAIDALRQRGLEPGREISLVGYDNIEERGPEVSDDPVLTTIDNPTDVIGQRAAEMLLNQLLNKQHQIVHERIPVELIVRKTTGPCPDRNS